MLVIATLLPQHLADFASLIIKAAASGAAPARSAPSTFGPGAPGGPGPGHALKLAQPASKPKTRIEYGATATSGITALFAYLRRSADERIKR